MKMRKYLLFILLISLVKTGYSQYEGITYQALIINNEDQEIPGIDISNNFLSEGEVSLRFTIVNGNGSLVYQEIHNTQTDRFGMINLVIGRGEETSDTPQAFNQIDWDGSPMDLLVEISYKSEPYERFSIQELYFVPYAFHRNITATGTLIVDGSSTLNSELTVANGSPTLLTGNLDVLGDATFQGNTTFNNITVLGQSDLQGNVYVGGTGNFYDSLVVHANNPTILGGSLNVQGNATLDSNLLVLGNLEVRGNTNLNRNLTVGDTTRNEGLTIHDAPVFSNDQVTINASLPANQNNYNNYPLRVEGSAQGIAVKVTAGTPNSNNNFITFFNSSNNAVGRIEGQTQAEMTSSAEYIFNTAVLTADVITAAAGLLAASTSSTICVGLGGCVTAPVPSLVVAAVANQAVAIANLAAYQIFAFGNLGVTYQSGSADYAEWLERANINEKMSFGEIVSVRGGKITKNTILGSKMMVISQKPAMLGNMPESDEASLYEKVAFLGQVPVKVRGKVEVGDYILPSGLNDGYGIARAVDQMETSDYKNIVGIAWSKSENQITNYINVAIGMNANDLAYQIEKQNTEIDELRNELNELKEIVNKILPGKAEEYLIKEEIAKKKPKLEETPKPLTADEMHSKTSQDFVVEALNVFKNSLEKQGIDIPSHPVYSIIYTESGVNMDIVNEIISTYQVKRQEAVEYDSSKGY